MMRQLEQSHDNVVGYSLSGEITDDDVTQAASYLRDEIARHDGIRVLFRLSDVSMSSFFTALDERFRFLQEHADDIQRVAIVTDDKATELLGKVSQATGIAETETFSMDDESKAWAWLS